MKKLFLFALLVFLCSCKHYAPNGQTSRYIAITKEGDSIEINAIAWEWAEGNVYFYSDNGDQFVRSVKHILLKE